MENPVAGPKIEILTKSILKPYGRAMAIPPAWELKTQISDNILG